MTERAHHEYQDGSWTAVAGDGFLALVEPDAPWRLVDGLWQVALGGGDVLGALGVVAADGFAALPQFALVRTDADGSVHAVLRGPVRLRLHGADGAQEVDARDGAVWTEHRALGVQGIEVVVEDAPAATWWPLVGGVVRAGGLRTGATAQSAVLPDTATHEQPVVAEPVHDAREVGDEPASGAEAGAVVASEPVEPVAAGEPELVVAPEPVVEPEPQPVVEAAPETVVEPEPEPVVDAEPEPVVAPEPEPVVAPEPELWPAAELSTAAVAPPTDAPPTDAPELTVDAWSFAPEPAPQPAAPEPAPAQHTAPEPEAVPDIPWWPLASPGGPAAAAPAPAPAEPEATEPEGADDHDGMTILSSDLARLRDRLPAWSQDAVPGPFATPEATPLPARLVLSTGLVVALDRAVLLGRAPQVARVTNRELPRLVTVPSPNQDISRTHAEVRVEGEHVVVTDLDSTNGVHVSRSGEGVRRLHPGEPSVVGTDEVVDLGDGVTFTVERSAS
ncbi:FHA domain-containing protein [Cellulomonas phragmiteti]|uniref:FHA domain-containing protein n=1 Tax=Cellulomonas phragmiteti TaxID=478780 RepID=A0ABQ4DKN4_9CELL|nr:FHA domain-containing protein [Cellulomonas phragmiteti]GIG39915.1 hypothetical protein Cph01nite_16770 [Cellulomonas phragmiteti]